MSMKIVKSICLTTLITLLIGCQPSAPTSSCLQGIANIKTSADYRLPESPSNLLKPDAYACLNQIFGTSPLHHPDAIDATYSPVGKYHGEDKALILEKIPHEAVYIGKLAETEQYQLYLAKINTGDAMEGASYDWIFTTNLQGVLVAQLLVGASGTMYQRDYAVQDAMHFSISETTGREASTGPSYQGWFTVNTQGGFDKVRSEVKPAEQASAEPNTAAEDTDLATNEGSLHSVPMSTDDSAIEAELVLSYCGKDESELEKLYIGKLTLNNVPNYLLIGKTPDGSKVVAYLFEALSNQPDKTHKHFFVRTGSRDLPTGSNFMGVSVKQITAADATVSAQVEEQWMREQAAESDQPMNNVEKTWQITVGKTALEIN